MFAEEVKVDIDKNHPFLNNISTMFMFVNGEIIKYSKHELQQAKGLKDTELNKACENAILSGFNHVINGVEYHFSFDIEAQINFQGSAKLLDDGVVEEIKWTVRNNGQYERISINKSIMDELTLVILQHKDENISKYRDELMPQVEDATTVEEVKKIEWQ